jgi:aconitate hydratase
VAGPRRPQDRVRLSDVGSSFERDLPGMVPAGFTLPDFGEQTEEIEGEDRTAEHWAGEGGNEPVLAGGALTSAHQTTPSRTAAAAPSSPPRRRRRRCVEVEMDGRKFEIGDGTVVIAAITSCTNTSNPSVMVGAGLVARKAVQRGLEVPPWVKTSMAPGSKVVSDYLKSSGTLTDLEKLGFGVVGYGCTTCIGNSGPLPEPIGNAVQESGLVVAAVLSGNRNFEARIHPQVRANYLASPMLVVAFALAGRVDLDVHNEPLGRGKDGKPVFLADIWPSQREIRDTISASLEPKMYADRYGEVFEGDDLWRALSLPDEGSLYDWDPSSTYIQNPPYFQGMRLEMPALKDIEGARVLAVLGHSVTTDHISPAGSIPKKEPAGRYLIEKGVSPVDFNTFGARRGNHEVMLRGTFGNVRIRNLMLKDKEGGYTIHFPTNEVISIYDASMRYQQAGTPLVILAGKEYGTGSSRDWAAKGTALLGVRAVIAESYERIHRSNLVGMGVLPLEFLEGQTRETLGLDGSETYSVSGIRDGLAPSAKLNVVARRADGSDVRFQALARLDSKIDVEYYRNGGILNAVLRKMAKGEM